jgi:hypothetical protein
MTRTKVRGFGVLLVLIVALAAAQAQGEPSAKSPQDGALHVTYYFMPG